MTDEMKSKWDVTFEKLVLEHEIGFGEFGSVLKGHYEDNTVAVKTLKWGADASEFRATFFRIQNSQFIGETSESHKLDWHMLSTVIRRNALRHRGIL